MAKPRVFISSTFYDLIHIRSSLSNFIESLGYEPILFEKGDIAYEPGNPLGESCCRDAANADIFVLIIGGRYGANTGGRKKSDPESECDAENAYYASITRQEYENAVKREVPVYIFIERSVYAEYRTYLNNKSTKGIKYTYVESDNIFKFIEQIESEPNFNPIHTFERSSEIESWLRAQWAGFYRELLNRRSQEKKLSDLSMQIENLESLVNMLKEYIEFVLKKDGAPDAISMIKAERDKLDKVKITHYVLSTKYFCLFIKSANISIADCVDASKNSNNIIDFFNSLLNSSGDIKLINKLKYAYDGNAFILVTSLIELYKELNEFRVILGLAPFPKINDIVSL